jgi:hypothetical protein
MTSDKPSIIQAGEVITPHHRPLTGFPLLAKLCAAATAFLNLQVIGGKFYVSGRNAVIDLTGSNTTAAVQAGAAAIKSFTVTGIGDEYLTGTFGALNVPVYKPPQFRPSFYTDQNSNIRTGIDFNPHTYTYKSLDQRFDGMAIGGVNVTFNDVLWPAYYHGDVVTAAYVENPYPKDAGGSDKFIWQDLNTAGRQWGWIDTICYQGYSRQIVNVGSKPYGGIPVTKQSLSSRLAGQTINIAQVITRADVADPNVSVIVPADPTQGAMYYQDTEIDTQNVWLWSPGLEYWINIIK